MSRRCVHTCAVCAAGVLFSACDPPCSVIDERHLLRGTEPSRLDPALCSAPQSMVRPSTPSHFTQVPALSQPSVLSSCAVVCTSLPPEISRRVLSGHLGQPCCLGRVLMALEGVVQPPPCLLALAGAGSGAARHNLIPRSHCGRAFGRNEHPPCYEG